MTNFPWRLVPLAFLLFTFAVTGLSVWFIAVVHLILWITRALGM